MPLDITGLGNACGPMLSTVLRCCGLSALGILSSVCHWLHSEVFFGTDSWELALATQEAGLALTRGELALCLPEIRHSDNMLMVQGGLSFGEKFMKHFSARNQLQDFALKSLQDFVVWLRRIARCEESSRFFMGSGVAGGGGSIAHPESSLDLATTAASASLRTLQRRLTRIAEKEVLMQLGLHQGLLVLRTLRRRCGEALGAVEDGQLGPAQTHIRLFKNLQLLSSSLGRLETNVQSFLSVAERGQSLARDLSTEATFLAARMASVLAADGAAAAWALDALAGPPRSALPPPSPPLRKRPRRRCWPPSSEAASTLRRHPSASAAPLAAGGAGGGGVPQEAVVVSAPGLALLAAAPLYV